MPNFRRSVAAAVMLLACTQAHATLGEPLPDVLAGRVDERVHLQSVALGLIDGEFELEADANRVLIGQWAALRSTVYCVAWDGPVKPDLQSLLGPQYFRLYRHTRPEGGGWLRAASTWADAGLVVHSFGRFGRFYGSACLDGRYAPPRVDMLMQWPQD